MDSLYRLCQMFCFEWAHDMLLLDGLETYFSLSMLMCYSFLFPSHNMTFKIFLHVLSYGIFKGLEQVDGHQILLPLMERNALCCVLVSIELTCDFDFFLYLVHLWASTPCDAHRELHVLQATRRTHNYN